MYLDWVSKTFSSLGSLVPFLYMGNYNFPKAPNLSMRVFVGIRLLHKFFFLQKVQEPGKVHLLLSVANNKF